MVFLFGHPLFIAFFFKIGSDTAVLARHIPLKSDFQDFGKKVFLQVSIGILAQISGNSIFNFNVSP